MRSIRTFFRVRYEVRKHDASARELDVTRYPSWAGLLVGQRLTTTRWAHMGGKVGRGWWINRDTMLTATRAMGRRLSILFAQESIPREEHAGPVESGSA